MKHDAGIAQGQPSAPPSAVPRPQWRQTLELLLMITSREITIRYKQSVMGFFWALFMPALVVLAGLVVRAGMAHLTGGTLDPTAGQAILVKALPWAFVVSALRLATNSLVGNSNLVTRARCPRIVFPLSAILSALFDMGVAFLPLIIVLAWTGLAPSWQLFWVIPLLLVLILLVGGIGTVLATANLFYRDVKYVVEVVLTFAIFVTPVLYEANMLGNWKFWVMCNPVAPVLEGLYSVVVKHQAPDLAWLGYSAAAAASFAWFARWMFWRLEPVFADRI